MFNLVMLCPSLSQPRYHKRANALAHRFTVSVIAFERLYYNVNKFSDNIDVDVVGQLPEGAIFKRLFYLFSVYKRLKVNSENINVFYALSLDLYLVAMLAGLDCGIYEVGDIRTAKGKNAIFRFLEKFVVSHSRSVVLTSKYFYSGYYENYGFPIEKYMIVENKLPRDFFSEIDRERFYKSRENKQISTRKRRIRIGVIGFFRYEKPINLLLMFARENKDRFEVHFFGDGPLACLIKSDDNENVIFHGPFSNPFELTGIYGSLDVNFVVYDNSDLNVRLALPNKLYESIYFCLPMIVASDTALEYEVVKKGVGVSVSLECRSFSEEMKNLSFESLEGYRENCKIVDPVDLIDDGNPFLDLLSGSERIS